MTLEHILILICITMICSVPFLHMGLYRYLSKKLSRDDDPE